MADPISDFQLRPLQNSKYHFRIRIWDTQREMEKQARADGSMTGDAQACFCGYAVDEALNSRIGDVYLFVSDELRRDAIHELSHAAVHYIRDIDRGNLNVPNTGEYASAAEEKLCRTMEHLISMFCLKLLQTCRPEFLLAA